jgi:type II secretory pathway pseudopilin PulG
VGDSGDTLIEILVAVLVIGITVTAMIGALTLEINGSDTHRRLTNVEVLSRAYGEKVVDQAMHPATTALASAASAGATSVHVKSSSGFPASPPSFTASVDGEVVTVTKIVGTTWTVSALADDHDANAPVVQYQPCPAAADLYVSGFAVASSSKVLAPDSRPGGVTSTVTGVEYFGADGTQVASASCPTYWSTVLPCSKFDSSTPDHLTECDVALIRVTLEFESTDKTQRAGATTTTKVLVRRGNA